MSNPWIIYSHPCIQCGEIRFNLYQEEGSGRWLKCYKCGKDRVIDYNGGFKMELTLIRNVLGKLSTIGDLFIDNVKECFTLEPGSSFVSESGQLGPIPVGRYEIIIRWSEKHQMNVPGLLNVAERSDVEIHPGNKPADTLSCILVGCSVGPQPDWIGESMAAFSRLLPKLQQACQSGKVFLTVQTNIAATVEA